MRGRCSSCQSVAQVALAGGRPLQGRVLSMSRFVLLLLFILAVYGLANAIAVLKIGRFFLGTVKDRKFVGRIPYLGDLFYCPPCLAFWIGMLFSWQGLSPTADLVTLGWRAILVDGLVASAAAYILHLSAERLGHGLKDI